MRKLLFINGHLNTGGVEKSLLDVLKHLDHSRYDVDLLLLEELGDYAPELPPQVHVNLRCLKNTYGSLPGCLLRCVRQRDWFCFRMRLIFLLMKLFGQKKIHLAQKLLTGNQHYDCVIGFRSGICTQIAAFAVNADKRITWWHHGEINVAHDSYLEVANACDQIAVVSEACRAMLAEEFPTLKPKLTIVPNMLDADAIRRKSDAFQPYAQRDVFHIVTLCRLSPEKHIENAILAAQKLKQAGILFQWHMVGSGSIESDLRKMAESADVADVFLFEGNQPNPYPYLKYADLFVHPSYVESQGLVVLEAMALGIPCVVTKSLGPCGFIEDGTNGILTEQSPDALAEKVLEMLTNKELYERIKVNTHCPERFSPSRVIEQIERILDERL